MRINEGFYAFTRLWLPISLGFLIDVYIAVTLTPVCFQETIKTATFSWISSRDRKRFQQLAMGFEQGGKGIAVGDYDNDGKLDILKTNFVAGLIRTCNLNQGGGIFEDAVMNARLAVTPASNNVGLGNRNS